jgi:hypothetical protein
MLCRMLRDFVVIFLDDQKFDSGPAIVAQETEGS